MPPLIHLVFKTHLDIGFADYAANVIQKYFRQFIPQAVGLAQRTRHDAARFRWTAGAWLVYEYLNQALPEERHMMEAAIEAGDILWQQGWCFSAGRSSESPVCAPAHHPRSKKKPQAYVRSFAQRTAAVSSYTMPIAQSWVKSGIMNLMEFRVVLHRPIR